MLRLARRQPRGGLGGVGGTVGGVGGGRWVALVVGGVGSVQKTGSFAAAAGWE